MLTLWEMSTVRVASRRAFGYQLSGTNEARMSRIAMPQRIIENKHCAEALVYWNAMCNEHDSTIIPPPMPFAADHESNVRNDVERCRIRVDIQKICFDSKIYRSEQSALTANF